MLIEPSVLPNPQSISLEAVPTKAIQYFNSFGRDLATSTEFGGPLTLRYENGDKVFAVPIHWEMYPGYDPTILVVELSHKDEELGFGRVIKPRATASYANDVPYVGYTKTTDGLERNGLGSPRLITMNALTEFVFGQSLNSNPTGNTSDAAKGVWNKLVDRGLAEIYEHFDRDRWRFKALHA